MGRADDYHRANHLQSLVYHLESQVRELSDRAQALPEMRQKLALAEALLIASIGDQNQTIRLDAETLRAARDSVEDHEVVWVHDKTTGDLVLRLARKGDPEPWKTEEAR